MSQPIPRHVADTLPGWAGICRFCGKSFDHENHRSLATSIAEGKATPNAERKATPNIEAIEGSDHMTNPVYDEDGWYVWTIRELIAYTRRLLRRSEPVTVAVEQYSVGFNITKDCARGILEHLRDSGVPIEVVER